jgi:hypothetical protein
MDNKIKQLFETFYFILKSYSYGGSSMEILTKVEKVRSSQRQALPTKKTKS